MNLKDLFKKKPTYRPKPEIPEEQIAPKKLCRLCGKVPYQGRSGEITINFVDGETSTVEIINQTNIEGRNCYSLFVMNDPAVGWNEVPIKFCPSCGRNLKRVN